MRRRPPMSHYSPAASRFQRDVRSPVSECLRQLVVSGRAAGCARRGLPKNLRSSISMAELLVSGCARMSALMRTDGATVSLRGQIAVTVVDELTDAGTHFAMECLRFIMQRLIRQECVPMKDKVSGSKGRKVSRSIGTNLSKRMAELQRLREQVRLAEVAMRP